MTIQELEAVTLEYLRDIYKSDYIGKLKVSVDKGYTIQLGMGTPEAPITIYAELQDEDFKKFLKKELRDRHLHPNNFGSIQLYYPHTCNHKNKKCCDQR